MSVSLPQRDLRLLMDTDNERSIYTHKNWLARDIFWSRLRSVLGQIQRFSAGSDRVLDMGGGSGAFLKGLGSHFESIDVVDWDAGCAKKIRDHLQLKAVRLFECDISELEIESPYDCVVATDVLEHFQDLSVPENFIKRVLRTNGLLFVSLPTENWLYLLGRTLVRKRKPQDHYHSADEVIGFLCAHGFETLAATFAPRYLIPIPLFRIAVLRLRP